MKRKIVAGFLAAAMVLASTAQPGVTAQAEETITRNGVVESGTCGVGLTWVLDENGTLTISGTGEIGSFEGLSSYERIINIVISKGVTEIGNGAFAYFSNLKAITIPEGVTEIGSRAFSGCSSLTAITIPEGVTEIGIYAFEDCSSLTEVNIPASVTEIGVIFGGLKDESEAFTGCYSLKNINVSADNPVYASVNGVLYNSDITELLVCPMEKEEVSIPNTVSIIRNSAFYECGNLTEVIIPSNVVYIEWGAFFRCNGLTRIDLPKNVAYIEGGAFALCENLMEINVSEDNQRYSSQNGVVYSKDMTEVILCPAGKQNVILPNSVTSIADCAFDGCLNLSNITIPITVTDIGESTFADCSSLVNITIPESVTSIGDYAFEHSYEEPKDVLQIHFKGDVPELGDFIFEGIEHVIIYYPADNNTWAELIQQDIQEEIWWGYEDDPEIVWVAVSDSTEEIIRQIESAESGATIEAALESTTVLAQEVFESLQGNDITLNLTLENGAVWSIHGTDLPESGLGDVDLSVTKTTKDAGNISTDVITTLAGERAAEQLVFGQAGEFSFSPQLTLGMSVGVTGEKGVLLQEVSAEGELILADSALVQGNDITFTIANGADSVVVYGTNGDTNGDDKVNITDMMQVLHHVSSRSSLNALQQGFADVDMNNSVNLQDLMRELHYVSGRSSSVY